LADRRFWPALILQSAAVLDDERSDALAAALDDYSPIAIEDRTPLPLPPGGLWDPTCPPPPEPPPAPLNWRVFFASDAIRCGAELAIVRAFPELALVSEDVPDEDWAARSQRELTAIEAGNFVVAPPWNIPAALGARRLIVIEPSRGFGTGHHQSTRLCLRALSNVPTTSLDVLDLGTGSGVLALAAALQGAHSVVAVDVDPDAIESARQSHALNPHTAGIDWVIGDFRDPAWLPSPRRWDVVLANLTGGMLQSSAARIRELMAPGSVLIASGFDRDERPLVEAALGLPVQAALAEDDWVGLVLG
jgi:ribosomal protein L11 methyltransferase